MVKENNLVKKFISLLLISVCLGDTLVLKNKTKYNGTLIKFDGDEIMFKAFLSTNWSKELSIDINDIQELKLYDGAIVIENGIIVATNEEHIKSTSYDRYLSLAKAAKAKRKPKNIQTCCTIIVILGLVVYYDIKNNLKWGGGDIYLP